MKAHIKHYRLCFTTVFAVDNRLLKSRRFVVYKGMDRVLFVEMPLASMLLEHNEPERATNPKLAFYIVSLVDKLRRQSQSYFYFVFSFDFI